MKLLELYTSIQGEGPNTGVPIQFVRFAGCNMRCPGWPCDTPQAIFPKQWKKEYEELTPEEVFYNLDPWPRHVCLTGGEPFLQRDLSEFIERLLAYDFKIDIFTNGSFVIPTQFIDHSQITIIMDWKLPGSGEHQTRVDERMHNAKNLTELHAVKFVVANVQDLDSAVEQWNILKQISSDAQIWVGAAWGHIEDAKIVEFVLENKLPWKLNVQQHKYIWDPDARYT